MRVVVVGCGIAGASAAFHLTQFGAEVSVVDNDAPGRATLAGAGIVCPWLSHNRDPRYEALAFSAAKEEAIFDLSPARNVSEIALETRGQLRCLGRAGKLRESIFDLSPTTNEER
jgi:D-amino-acid dehydrogenase